MEGKAFERTRFLAPAAPLRCLIRCYIQREAIAESSALVHPVPARATPILEFVIADLFEVHWCNRSLVEVPSRAVIIGLQTHRRVCLKTNGRLESFCIVFQPGGLFRLFSLPVHELTDHDCDARAVLGNWISALQVQLSDCGSFVERARTADACMLRVAEASAKPDSISRAAGEILNRCGELSIGDLASKAGLSLRQFERRFHDQVGMRPKLYARIARFEAALDAKARARNKTWTEVAHEFGYHDQMHLVHDFEQFSGEPPTGVLTELRRVHYGLMDPVRGSRPSAESGTAHRIFL
jgi:AraC-like DNA-binding protein